MSNLFLDDIDRLAIRMQEGDTGAGNALTEAMRGRMHKVATTWVYRRQLPNNVLPDLIQTAMIGMLRAVKTYSPDRGRFTTYAYFGAYTACRKFCDDQASDYHVDTLIGYDLVAPPPHEPHEEHERLPEVLAMIDTLTPLQQACIRAKYGIGQPVRSSQQYAAEIGISKSAVNAAIQRGLATLKAQFEAMEGGRATTNGITS